VTVGLSATGALNVFNNAGSVDVIIDIVGYYQAAAAGPGARGLSAWDTIPSGQTVTGNFGVTEGFGQASGVNYSVSLPAVAPVAISAANVNFAPDAFAETIDDDPTCTGTAANPTAPPGKVCLYRYGGDFAGGTGFEGFSANNLGDRAFYVAWTSAGGTTTASLFLTWAYTAP